MKIQILGFCTLLAYLPLWSQQYEGYQFNPEKYVAHRSIASLEVDGKLDEESWKQADWTNDFVDIEGDHAPAPPYRQTRIKMLWDDDYLYIGAEMIEPDIWATYTERDAVIFHENDFEVFIDPDGDSHNYYELEINALGTIWDLILLKPYRDGGPALNAWDIAGLKSGVHVYGTLNDPSDEDEKWTVELAFPWAMLKEAAKPSRRPEDGEQWRMNFSRVHWRIKAENGVYVKETDPTTGKNLSEFNWVWSEQGKIAMHQPETWGYVQFSETPVNEKKVAFMTSSTESVRWSLYQYYYAQRAHFQSNGSYAASIDALALQASHRKALSSFLSVTVSHISFDAIYREGKTILSIDQEGKLQNLSQP
ncbi:MAG: carbohydrate-binding family 9-like protein [Cytophagales bacterium]|nr:carbohydrate-binding family 9-like protein [Cytophagales bacterium]